MSDDVFALEGLSSEAAAVVMYGAYRADILSGELGEEDMLYARARCRELRGQLATYLGLSYFTPEQAMVNRNRRRR